MAKAKKKSEYKQLDIFAASKGKDEVYFSKEDEIMEEEITQKKAVGLFEFIDDIRKHKKGTMLDEEKNVSSWNTFMILQALSMKEDDVLFCNFLNQFQGTMSKQQMYQALVQLIPKDNTFHKWIKSNGQEKSDYAEYVSKYFLCSEKEAIEYIQLQGEDWAKSIKSKFGGLE